MDLVGVVLAAGAGRRFGGPKALARGADGTPWTAQAARVLEAAGCGRVLVVLGAEADAGRRLVPEGVEVVVAERWADGIGASLAAGLDAAGTAEAVLLTLVDLPGMPAGVARRVADGATRSALRRAVVGGRPTHPVLVGRDRLAALRASLRGDAGARTWLAAAGAEPVEVGDLWDGADVDVRPAPSPAADGALRP